MNAGSVACLIWYGIVYEKKGPAMRLGNVWRLNNANGTRKPGRLKRGF
jgi:hypothetical protein